MRIYNFAKRNIKELLRDPMSLLFLFLFPIVLFIVMQLIVRSVTTDLSHTPQFEIDNMTVSMCIFGFSFITIFSGNQVALDRESSFMLRLKSSPMNAKDFILGYTLTYLPLAFIVEVLMVLIGFCFGLAPTWNIILMILILYPFSLIFIGLGLLFGSLVSSKAVGGLASSVPTISSLLGGMFFPLDIMSGGFKTFCYVFPFANVISLGRDTLSLTYTNDSLSNALISYSYVIVIYIVAILIFHKNLKGDKI